MALKMTRGSGNIFVDVGFPPAQAAVMLLRADLAIHLELFIRNNGLTQARAAKLFGVSQPRVSDLMRHKIERFSIDTLVEMIGRAGAHVTISVTRTRELRETTVRRATLKLRGTRGSGLAAGRENGRGASAKLSRPAASPESRVPRPKSARSRAASRRSRRARSPAK